MNIHADTRTHIHADGIWFKDEHGRTLLLRGVNLGGSSKIPARPDGATHRRDGFFDHRTVSFVGRPFPLDQADEHFTRLRTWGLTLLRFLVTWEAIEHQGPGCYDEAYLDYVQALLEKAGEYGFTVFIDPHQDVWSRFTGGDGAPGWTLEAVGLDMRRFHQTGAAVVHQLHGDPFPPMLWSSNHVRLAAATMFTLFFAGDDFAPRTTVAGVPVQQYLQQHYIEAVRQVALRLRDMPHVIGYGVMNEPSTGYIGLPDVRYLPPNLRLGRMPTPYQSMLLGAGCGAQATPGVTAWLDGHPPVWEQNGVWSRDDRGQPRLLRPAYFAQVGGRLVDFEQDYLRPFANRFAARVREAHPEALIMVETDVIGGREPPRWGPDDACGVVYAPHWYDGLMLVTRRYTPWLMMNAHTLRPVLGWGAVRRSYSRQLQQYQTWAHTHFGGVPTIIAEIGIPYDMHNRRAYRTGDFSVQARAIDASMRALESNLLNFTWWNYNPENTNARGDRWNGEDLSIFSRDQQTDPDDIHSGGRALAALVRPYARAVAGEPLRMSFDRHTGRFVFTFRHDGAAAAPTEFFIPALQYPEGCRVEVSDGTYQLDWDQQRLCCWHTTDRETHTVIVLPARPRPGVGTGRRGGWLLVLLAALALLAAAWAWLRRSGDA